MQKRAFDGSGVPKRLPAANVSGFCGPGFLTTRRGETIFPCHRRHAHPQARQNEFGESKSWDHKQQRFVQGHIVVTAAFLFRGVTLPWTFAVWLPRRGHHLHRGGANAWAADCQIGRTWVLTSCEHPPRARFALWRHDYGLPEAGQEQPNVAPTAVERRTSSEGAKAPLPLDWEQRDVLHVLYLLERPAKPAGQ